MGRIAAGLLAFAVMFGSAAATRAGTTGEILGRIVDRATHASVSGATVTAMSTTGTYRAVTDRNGFFSIVGAFPNTYLVSVSAPDFGSAETLGGSVNPDQAIVVDLELDRTSSTLSSAPVPNALSIVRSNLVPDLSVLTAAAADAANGSGGSYGLYSTPGILGTLPGVTLDEGVNAHVRGGRLDEVGYDYDGVGAVDPITGLAATDLIQDGIVRLQVDESGDDSASVGGLAGVVDSVVGVGSYPARGSITTLVETPTFYNGANFSYGSATPDRRFSWFVSGVDWNSAYDWGTRGEFVPGAQSAETALGDGPVGQAAPTRDQVVNVHYRPGGGAADDVQFLAASGFERFEDLLAVKHWPSTDPLYGASTSPTPVGGLCDVNGFALFPGQLNCTAGAGDAADHVDQSFSVEKLQYTHDFGSDATVALRYASVDSTLLASVPFGDGPFADLWENRHSVQQEFGIEYSVQTSRTNFLRTGIGSDASANDLLEAFVSNQYGIVVPVDTHDADAWVSDELRPTSRLTVDAGGRALSRSYAPMAAPGFTTSGTEGSFGAAYALGASTVLRGSFGDQAELPTASRVEEIVTHAPLFSDTAPANRIRAVEAQPVAPQSHSLDFSVERSLAGGRAIKVTPFWRTSPDLIVAVGGQFGMPESVGQYDVNGIDAQVQFEHPGDGIGGYVDYTHTRALAGSVGDFGVPIGVGALAAHALFPVAFVQPDVADLVLTWRHGKWSVNPEASFTTGYPYGAGRFTYNDLHCAASGPTSVGDPSLPCGAVVRNPAAYSDTVGGNCGPGACTHLLDPAESAFADGRVCCAALTANLNISYAVASRTQLGVQWENVTDNVRALALAKNPYFPVSPYGPPGFNGFVGYGATPYIPAALDNSQEFLFTITQRI